MGNTAENVAEKFQITREQDEFALASQQKAGSAQAAGTSTRKLFRSPSRLVAKPQFRRTSIAPRNQH